ncbi:MAG TPA: contractile injection system protein, VgrG/Pvc8 family [Noviherbaspirillum sp.]|nr:contractile injection system protein, VgrG/Pvc8 family [Noviherbaspirillum sp.]
MNERVNSIGESAIAAVSDPSPALFLHCGIFAAGNRLISDETFRLVSFQGQESVSEPFEYQLELHGNTSPRHGTPLKFDDVIGRPITVGIQYPSAYSPQEMSARFQGALVGEAAGEELSLFNGIVTTFTMDIPGVYRVTMKPDLWKLTLTNRYQIHRQKNIRDAIADLLEAHRISYSMDAVSGDDNLAVARIQDWLQAGESDFELLRRLMGKAHLYYYFTHTGNSHKMVFVNRTNYPYPYVFASRKPLRYTYTGIDELGLAQSDVISQYNYQRSLTSSSVRSVFTRQEAAWEADPVAQFQSFHANSAPNPGELPFNQYKIYQYGCSKEEVRHFAESTSQAMETASSQFAGSSFCAHFRVGHQFAVTGDVMADSNPKAVRPSLEGQRFVLTQVKHQANADGGYSNEFQSTEADGFLAAFSLQETQQGVVLAKVVAKAGTTPPQDWRYYTPDYFDPETNTLVDNDGIDPGHKLEAIGVYVRFSTDSEDTPPVWVKLAPSMQTVPEIGVTVTVTRAQDESELPEIQSIIQANGSMVIMPSTWTANTHVGSSYSTNYGDSQGIRFGKTSAYNLPKAVGIVRTAYESGKYRDTSFSQGASYSYGRSENESARAPDQGELFGPYAGATDLLSASESFGSNYSRQYAQVTSSFSDIGTTYSKSTIGKTESYSTITGTSYSENTHGGDITSITTINADSFNTSTQTGNTTSSNTLTGNATSTNINNGNVTSTTAVTGTSDNTSTYGGQVTSNTTHNAPVVSTTDHHGDVTSTTTHYDNVDSTTTIKGDSTSHNTIDGTNTSYSTMNVVHNFSTTAAQSSSSAVGATNSNDAIGVTNSNSAIGLSNKNTIMGASLDLNAIGASASVNAIGSSTSVNLIGNSNSIEMIGPGFQYSNKAIQPKVEVIDIRLTMIDILQIYL